MGATPGHFDNYRITLAWGKYFYITRNMKHESTTTTCLPIEIAASSFAALGSEQRLEVLRHLVRAGPDGLRIGTLGQKCGITGSTLTHHLKILTGAELIRQEKQGRSIICVAANYSVVKILSDYLRHECCADCIPDFKEQEHG